jgi:hypothetical protein
VYSCYGVVLGCRCSVVFSYLQYVKDIVIILYNLCFYVGLLFILVCVSSFYNVTEGVYAPIWCKARAVFRIWGCMCRYVCQSYVDYLYLFYKRKGKAIPVRGREGP